jgi:hypothetical protein
LLLSEAHVTATLILLTALNEIWEGGVTFNFISIALIYIPSNTGGIKIFSMEKETKIINWEQDFYTPQNSISS